MTLSSTHAPAPPARRHRRYSLAAAGAGGAALIAGLGWVLVAAGMNPGAGNGEESIGGRVVAAAGGWAARLSYDLLSVLGGRREAPGARIVYLDERAAAKLGQKGGVWDRSLHTQLVRRLTREGARAVFFDIVFPDASSDPAVDAELAEAMRENGRVFLGAALELEDGENALQERVVPPIPVLRKAAAGWGLITFRPIDADYGVRRLYAGLDLVPSAAWRAAEQLGARLPAGTEGRAEKRWLRYYGPADSFPNVSYDRALDPEALPPGYFRDQIVCIGGRSTLGTLMLGKDDFRTPHGLLGGKFATGVELHLTQLLNLLRGDWLRRLAPGWEMNLVLIWGLLLGGGLPWLRPGAAAVAAVLAGAAVAAVAMMLHGREHLWFAWIVPGAVQPVAALGWAVGARYFVEERRRQRLLDAFSRYLSPQMARRIAETDFDLAPGGKVMRATVMFTDLENYSSLCERIDDPQRIARVLNTYYTRTIGHVLESDGTVIKYMGDSIQAVWGAPLEDAEQVRKAVRAAWRVHVASLAECEGHSLRTRIGLHLGQILAGNLGSAERFDFAVIGHPVNLASRFEGLNKHLGTDILVSEDVRAEMGSEFDSRPLGRFRVAGARAPQTLHELLGPAGAGGERPWLAPFGQALADFQRGDLEAAEKGMRAAAALRPGGDAAALFFVGHIGQLRISGLPAPWEGVVEVPQK